MAKTLRAILPVGTRVWNNGDMANPEHRGTITAVEPTKFGHLHYQITPEADAERPPYWVPAVMFSDVFEGHGGTRFVTEAAYMAWRQDRMDAFLRSTGAVAKGTELVRAESEKSQARHGLGGAGGTCPPCPTEYVDPGIHALLTNAGFEQGRWRGVYHHPSGHGATVIGQQVQINWRGANATSYYNGAGDLKRGLETNLGGGSMVPRA